MLLFHNAGDCDKKMWTLTGRIYPRRTELIKKYQCFNFTKNGFFCSWAVKINSVKN